MPSPVLDLLLPERCAACGQPGRGLCGRCLLAAVPLRVDDGIPLSLGPGVLALAPYLYDGVIARAVRDTKRPGHHAAAVWLGELLWAEMTPRLGRAATWPRTWVPSSPARLRARGAEIPRLLAGDGARVMLRRVRQSGQQKQRSASERRRSGTSDFEPTGPVPTEVMLVDDVRTTGATMRAAATALREAGVSRVVGITLAAALLAQEPAGVR